MKYEIPSFKTIDIDDIKEVIDIDYDLQEVEISDISIDGNLLVKGVYLDNLDKENTFLSELDFTIISENNEVDKIDVVHFDYQVIRNSGIEILFTIEIEFNDLLKKKVEVKEVFEEALKSNFEVRHEGTQIDSFLDFFKSFSYKYITYKIKHINSEKDLEDISRKYSIPIEKLFKDENYLKSNFILIKNYDD